MVQVPVIASSENADRYVLTCKLDQTCKLFVTAKLITRTCPDGDCVVVEETVVASESPFTIEFKTEIRALPFWSSVELEISESRSGLDIGSLTIPVFNNAGVLLTGRHVFPLNQSTSVSAEISKLIDNFHASHSISGQSGSSSWNLPEVSPESILRDLRVLTSQPLALIDLNDGSKPVTIFSDSFRSSHHMVRQLSTEFLSRFVPASEAVMDASVSGSGVASNWMVVNGPMKSFGSGAVPGSGYIADLNAAMAPAPSQVIDYELFKEHPAALKSLRLHRHAQFGSVHARPNADEIGQLNAIVAQPMRDLSVMERELLLKFMWSLTDKKQALLKVILVAVEAAGDDAEQTVSRILHSWTAVDLDGALSLLGEEIGRLPSVVVRQVRNYAVERLAVVATNAEIQLYLFQLVQSLRYDDDAVSGWLIQRACQDEALATLLFWQLQCEAFSGVSEQLWRELGRSDHGRRIRDGIELQCQFRDRLMEISQIVASPPRSVDSSLTKSDVLREAIRGNLTGAQSTSIISKINLTNKLNFPQIGGDAVEIPIAVDPILSLIRVDEQKSFCIKSAKSPFVLSCEVFDKVARKTDSRRYMFKTGDDLRQDQLVIQFISLFDGLFKSYGLDLKLSPYKVLATSLDDGFIEFVADSQTLSSILTAHNNDLLAYFRSVRPRADAQYGVDPNVLDTFARSCAGYCAITYVLGIGDRHMDNLLVCPDGRLFHVDFGYILGRDPKPFPPPMKLCREMVEGMGGAGSVYYRSFVSKCTQAFLIMRRHANLLVSLLYLATGANLKDMREQDPTLAILKVQKRLMPELSDEVAEQQMIALINESVSALFPVVMEKLHKWAIYWR